jgi:phosphotransferase system HPr (HPr) family protein
MFELQATIKNQQGIHCRPSAVIMKSIDGYQGRISLQTDKAECDSLSILGLMSMGLEYDEVVTIQVEGDQEEHICNGLVTQFETIFDFPPEDDEDSGD